MSSAGLANFQRRFLAFESGIDPDRFDTYVARLHEPALKYWRVAAPGHIERDQTTGLGITETITFAEYFRRIGVDHLFDPGRPACIEAMQAQATNPWGFVGFQFGELILIDMGYYEPANAEITVDGQRLTVPVCYFGGVPQRSFAGNVRFTVQRKGDGWLLASDVNRWDGRFTGLDGIRSLDDFKTPAAQRKVFLRSLRLSYARIAKRVGPPDEHFARSRSITLSGVLAAAHLVGAEATVARLEQGLVARDEAGTSVDDYLQKFSGFDVCPRDLGIEATR